MDAEVDVIYFTAYTEDAAARTLEIQGGDRFELSEAKPEGAAMAVLTFYGVDDATYDAVDRGWQPWWAERQPSEQPTDS